MDAAKTAATFALGMLKKATAPTTKQEHRTPYLFLFLLGAVATDAIVHSEHPPPSSSTTEDAREEDAAAQPTPSQ